VPDTYKLSLPLRGADDADPSVAEPLTRIQQQMGMVPNMYAAMANLPALLEAYQHGYQLVRSQSGFTPIEQEVLFLTISRENFCTYCVAAHSFVADAMTKVPAEITNAIRSDAEIQDEKLEALRRFAATMVRTRGNPGESDATGFLGAGFTEQHILGVILAISVKTLSNYSNHVFHTELDQAFKGCRWNGPTKPEAA
jgi:uncharacterized peroxidase-related enzyme